MTYIKGSQVFNLFDEGTEDAIYDRYAMRTFMHIDFNEQQTPDANKRLDESGLIKS